MTDLPPIKPRERDAVLLALRAGVSPRIGLQHIAVGRSGETQQMLLDLDRVADGGASFRLIVGDYGAGKTFFLTLTRAVALEKRFVAMTADLSPERRLFATDGQARSLFAELSRNTATRTKPDGEALRSIVERFAGDLREQSAQQHIAIDTIIRERLNPLTEMVFGYDFVSVVTEYVRAYEAGDDARTQAALRWLRGEWTTKTDARNALGVRAIINDDTVYDALKLYARFFRIAGYAGLLVTVDELVNLYKLNSAKARSNNYEQILRMLNDVLQGGVDGLGILLGGTPEFLLDTRRGLYSYEALRSRLEENRFAGDGLVDLSGPVIRLEPLSREDLFVLLQNIRRIVQSSGSAVDLPDSALAAFLDHCEKRIGAAYFKTPRNTIRAFVDLMSVLKQNPASKWSDLLDEVDIAPDLGAANDQAGPEDDELAELRI
ncbi:MAG TPA: ATP-binding protein [Caulobacteraceae bacterium]|jgi:hypothetical protein|nr:ATP-binding protein [Caulobacteraceae bacterium]